jgi:hypothetical protein
LPDRASDAAFIEFGEYLFGQNLVGRRAKDAADTVLFALFHCFLAAIMAVAAEGDLRVPSLHADASDQPAQMGTHFLPVSGLSRTQYGQHAMAGIGGIYMDRQKAAFVIVCVEQAQLLMAVHRVRRVIDIEHDGLWWAPVALAPQIHHGVR